MVSKDDRLTGRKKDLKKNECMFKEETECMFKEETECMFKEETECEKRKRLFLET